MNVTSGVVRGTFMPPHAGHRYLIDFARGWAEALTIALFSADDDAIDGTLRAAWLAELFPFASLIHIHSPTQLSAEDQASALSAELSAPVDALFGSDAEDAKLAAALGIRHIPVDPERVTVPAHASAIREDALGNWEFIPDCVRPHYVQRICIFGPRGSGKTSLAEQLAIHYDTVSAFEYRASHVSMLGREPPLEDLEAIAMGQLAAEDAMARQANRLLFCDSNHVGVAIEAELRFGEIPPAVQALGTDRAYALYLLMDVDGEWAMGTGVKPSKRHQAEFEHYRQHLINADLRYLRLDGDYDTRFRIACDAVDNITGQPTGRPPRPEYLRSA